MSLWITDADPVELRPNFTEDDLQFVIRAVYKQVLGNAHVLESERLSEAESQLRNGDINVRGFVSMVAKSDLYKSLFFNSSSQYRFIELNCKHLLGRAPLDQAEISAHVQTYSADGYDADIDSYIDSDEYNDAFGENTVPYARTATTEPGVKNVGFNRTFALYRGYATSDSSNSSALVSDLAGNKATAIKPAVAGGGTPDNTSKRFRISVTKSGTTPVYKRSNTTFEVDYASLSKRIQAIHKTGGKIVSITELG